ncbi:SGNH/GDSL hydrolase family protein [Tautonia sociabilis]|uniref:SGNH/GDSL hydrolase family protein n=1 Tax=Tautonia sociabilis TaxID=2080755 RepID=A0A432MCW8_9BACT|nr:SGNH/GDSL hydrolase family protein [Tautonia sociabilis]RUL81622.1 SGNH/GDSL hydrolase family protein [Tautonia sociabilis]
MNRNASTRARVSLLPALLASGAMLAAGLVDWPAGRARTAMQALRSAEPNRADREANAGGYYEGLINRGDPEDRASDEVALRLLGAPDRWISFHDMGATHYLPDSFLQFQLFPNVQQPVLDHVFTTNSLGLRDREGYAPSKPEGTFRIVLLGSSIDMGWGVDVDATYENWLEDWLNARAEKIGLDRRFEVINFAMAAYGPAQRLERFRTLAAGFDPDLVLYSGTMLDARLSEIHLCDLIRYRADPSYDFVRSVIAAAKLTDLETELDPEGHLRRRARLKAKLSPFLWVLCDGAVGELADECRSAGVPLVYLVIPRAGLSDAPGTRDEGVARHAEIARRHGIPLLDLTAAFDEDDANALALAPWDDHPNAEGHRLIFYALARALIADDELSRMLFGAEGGGRVRPPGAEVGRTRG